MDADRSRVAMAYIGIEYHSMHGVNVGGESGHEWVAGQTFKRLHDIIRHRHHCDERLDLMKLFGRCIIVLSSTLLLEKFSLVASLIHYNIKLQFK